MTAPSLRLSTLRLAWLLLAGWALLVQGFGTGLAAPVAALDGTSVAELCASLHGDSGETPDAPASPRGLPHACLCPFACAAAVALPTPPPVLPERTAARRPATRSIAASLSTAPRFDGPPPGRGPPSDLA